MNSTVVMLINSLQGGGAERVFSLLANRLNNDIEVVIVLLDNKPIKYKISQNIEVVTLDSRIPGLNIFYFCLLLFRSRPETVLSFLSRSNFINIISKYIVPHRSIVSERTTPTRHFACKGIYGAISKKLIKIIYPLADSIIAVSGGVRDDLANHFNVNNANIFAVPNPYDLDEINARGSISLNSQEEFICAVGRLDNAKRFDLLIRSYAESRIQAVLYILGEGPLYNSLTNLIVELGVENKVKLLGFVDNPYQYLKRAKYFVLSSGYEGFPNVLVEALALGTPVIATDCESGPREILDPEFSGEITDVHRGKYGLLVPVGSVQILSTAMVLLNSSAAIRSEYQGKAISRAKDFDIDSIYSKYLSVIEI